MSNECAVLHNRVASLEKHRWPLEKAQVPRNGIYFFFEEGEISAHDGLPRIVRVGTHRDGNFASRMADHFVDDPRKMNLSRTKPSPKDRSIFRKNLGRAILNRDGDPYLAVWNIDFTTIRARETHAGRRDIQKERRLEEQVSQILRRRFSPCWIPVEGQERRMGRGGLEAALIGTLSRCGECGPGPNWLGRHSPKRKIAKSGLWLEQHLAAPTLSVDQVYGLFEADQSGT